LQVANLQDVVSKVVYSYANACLAINILSLDRGYIETF
jgi:hypothetical protein